MTEYEPVENAINEIVKEFNGRLDIFVANSGIPWTQGPALDGELSHYHKVVNTDLDGTFFSARAAGKHWRRQKQEGTTIDGQKLEGFTYGSFVATASMSAHIVVRIIGFLVDTVCMSSRTCSISLSNDSLLREDDS